MSNLAEEALNEALEHDEARKEAEAKAPTQDATAAVKKIDERLVMAAKSLGCVLLAKALELSQKDSISESELNQVERMISLAGRCDTLGDKALLR